MSRMVSPQAYWKRIGRGAANLNREMSAVTTGVPNVDRWIATGYNEIISRRERKARAEYRLICQKAGVL